MEKILISACLIGDKCNYLGKSNYSPFIKELLEKYELVPFCGEVEGGLSVPRDPCEIKNGLVITKDGKSTTRIYETGAERGLNICQYLGIRIAILKDRSPMCGVYNIHNGRFDGNVIAGQGILASLLKKKGIRVISENDIETFLKENE